MPITRISTHQSSHFAPTDAGGLTVAIAAGKLQQITYVDTGIGSGPGVYAFPATNVVVPDNQTSYIVLEKQGTYVVLRDLSLGSNFGAGVFAVAKVVTSGGDITSLIDLRTPYTADPSRYELNVYENASLQVHVNSAYIMIGSTRVAVGGVDIAIVDDESNWLQITPTGTIISNITGMIAGNYPLAEVRAAAGVITYIDDYRSFISFAADLSSNNFADFKPTINTNGTDVDIAAGRLRARNGDGDNGIFQISAQTVTPAQIDSNGNTTGVESIIMIRRDGTTFVHQMAGQLPIDRGAFIIARVVVDDGDITTLEDKRSVFGTDRAFDDFDLTWSRDSLDVTVNNGIVRKLGGRLSGQYKFLAVQQTFTLTADNHFIIYLDQDSDDSRHVDIKFVEIGNIDNIGLPANFIGTPIYAVATNATGIDQVYDLRTVQNMLGEDAEHFSVSNDFLQIRIAPNAPLIVRPRDGEDLGPAGLDIRNAAEGNALSVDRIQDLYLNAPVGADNNSPGNIKVIAGKLQVNNVVFDVPDTNVPGLTNSALNYVEISSAGTVSSNTTGFTSGRLPIGTVTLDSGAIVTASTDRRALFSVIISESIDYIDSETPSGTINGSNTVFTLANTPSPVASLHLYLNGLRQRAGGQDYTLSGLTITFVTAPSTGDILLADYRY